MDELIVVPDVVPNCAEIIEIAERHRRLFEDYPSAAALENRGDHDPLNPYRDSEYEDDDRYHVLQATAMPVELRRAILAGLADEDSDLSRFYFQINRYDRGDYILPHRDKLQQGLYMLSDSAADGLVVQAGDGSMAFVADRAGTLVHHDPAAWHWVDPVRSAVRYTLVTISARPPRKRS
ncbi:hypothetical protein ABH920_001456 [Catenulispora sp. EB89]|uniref:2OG-Fe(II) oxygenase family protein n=1 Tax=Catenulispora sp. EB89 TaxID=3156257 RepID=UPI003510FA32